MSNVLNPEGIDITLNRMIISQIQMLVERYLIHRLRLKIYHTVNRFFLPETTIDKQSMTRYNIRKEQMFDTRGGI